MTGGVVVGSAEHWNITRTEVVFRFITRLGGVVDTFTVRPRNSAASARRRILATATASRGGCVINRALVNSVDWDAVRAWLDR